MRALLFVSVITLLAACNNGDEPKDPNQAMDDTARMLNPPPQALLFNRVFLMSKEIPSVIKVKGKFVEASKWTDSLGENYLVLSSEGPFDDKGSDGDEDGQTIELYAAHYIQKGNDYPRIWNMKDAVKACPFDITAKFIPGSTTITDVDKDGVAELKVQWLNACRSDVSPAMMQLVMAENGKAYKLTGSSWVPLQPGQRFELTENNSNIEALPPAKDAMDDIMREMGRYFTEKEFAAASPEFIVYARKEWLKHVMEKMGE
jgi:hypothetical protein